MLSIFINTETHKNWPKNPVNKRKTKIIKNGDLLIFSSLTLFVLFFSVNKTPITTFSLPLFFPLQFLHQPQDQLFGCGSQGRNWKGQEGFYLLCSVWPRSAWTGCYCWSCCFSFWSQEVAWSWQEYWQDCKELSTGWFLYLGLRNG